MEPYMEFDSIVIRSPHYRGCVSFSASLPSIGKHVFGSGAPQSFQFPSNAEALKLWSWVPVGLIIRDYYERLNFFKKFNDSLKDPISPTL